MRTQLSDPAALPPRASRKLLGALAAAVGLHLVSLWLALVLGTSAAVGVAAFRLAARLLP